MAVSAIMRNTKRRAHSQRGAALVIAIFSLMLISVVATALIVTAGTQNSIKSNYRSAMRAFYDAKAGLEEGRGRLWTNNPDSAAILNCVFPGGVPMQLGQACYIINPAPGENVDPRNLNPANTYADAEYGQEWGGQPPPSGAPLIASTSPNMGVAGPLYKWVRITPRTEASGGLDVNGGTQRDPTNPLYFDGAHQMLSAGGPVPGTAQVLTITSLAVTPSGSRRMLQYTVAGPTLTNALPTFPAAVTLDGNGFTIPSGNGTIGGSSDVQIDGHDGSVSGTSAGVPAVGYTNSNDASAVTKAASPASDYLSPQNTPAVGNVSVSLPPLLQTPSGLDSLVQGITRGADLVLNPPSGTQANQTSLTLMSPTNPMVVVVNGDFRLSHGSGGSFTGYGLLVVTGTLYYDPDDSWNGIILVIGRGVFDGSQHGSTGQINGAVLVANTRDSSGNLLTSLGATSFKLTGGGQGIHYNSQLVNSAEGLMTYQVLSFREIQQTGP
jgi:hypothetical protein